MPDTAKKYHVVNPPSEHRMEGELRVCDPVKTDHTKDMETWRIFKIMAEFIEGFALLKRYKLAVTFFGSARSHLNEDIYEDATELAKRLSESGFAVITGGAAGIMGAANKGAYEAGGASIGLNIKLPEEQQLNRYLTDGQTFNYFFSRKVMLAFASEAYIFFPGGYGTLDEFLEILTLSQTRKIKRIPIILFDKAYWEPVVALFRDHLAGRYRTIDPADLDLFRVVDTVDEAYETILREVKC
jgi:uncharacterized protein (TIGR00730 family)